MGGEESSEFWISSKKLASQSQQSFPTIHHIEVMADKFPSAFCNSADIMWKLTKSGDDFGSLINSSYISILIFNSIGAVYDKFREDPVFPTNGRADFRDTRKSRQKAFINEGKIGILGCIDNAYICGAKSCWPYPASPLDQLPKLSMRLSDNGLPMEFDQKQLPVPMYNEKTGYYSFETGEYSFAPIEVRAAAGAPRPTEAELTRILLSRALLGSNICQYPKP